MIKKIHTYLIGTAVLITPAMALAQKQTLSTVITKITGYLNSFLVLLMGLAVVFFVFYVARYFIFSVEKKKEAGQYVLYSLIGFFVILSVWGLVNILKNTFNLQDNSAPTLNDLKNLFPGGSGASGGSNSTPTVPPVDSGGFFNI